VLGTFGVRQYDCRLQRRVTAQAPPCGPSATPMTFQQDDFDRTMRGEDDGTGYVPRGRVTKGAE